ncbi:tetratricopeptide repeat protein, partial [Rhizobium sp. BR5]
HNLAVSLITVLLPALGLCLYIWNGSPETPDMPLEARLENPGNDMNLLVARAERHLAQNPEDGAGWDVLAPIYFKTMRLGDAELAYRNALRLDGPNPERLTGLGETLVAGNEG